MCPPPPIRRRRKWKSCSEDNNVGQDQDEEDNGDDDNRRRRRLPPLWLPTAAAAPSPDPVPPQSPAAVSRALRLPSAAALAAVFASGAAAAVLLSLLLSSFLHHRDRDRVFRLGDSRSSSVFPDSVDLALAEAREEHQYFELLGGGGDTHVGIVVENQEELPETESSPPPAEQSDFAFPYTSVERRRPSQVRSYRECEAEALQTLHAAVAAASSAHGSRGKQRAARLFEHAAALCPNHPRVLLRYGEFLEDGEKKDLIRADHLFARAAAFSEPDSEERSRALSNRRRTSPLVEELDRGTLRRIDDKKRAFQKISGKGGAPMRRAKKEAYFQHIYHTVGIEGNTLSLAQTRSVLETKLAVGGKSVVEHNEVLGMDAALRYINQTLVDRVGEYTLQDILEIHRRVIGYVDPVEAGMMRRTQVFVGDYVPPHPSHIELLMHRFVAWLNSPENAEVHPINLAALAHYKLVYIHPFVDGNGRTSRLLMNLILMQSG